MVSKWFPSNIPLLLNENVGVVTFAGIRGQQLKQEHMLQSAYNNQKWSREINNNYDPI